MFSKIIFTLLVLGVHSQQAAAGIGAKEDPTDGVPRCTDGDNCKQFRVPATLPQTNPESVSPAELNRATFVFDFQYSHGSQYLSVSIENATGAPLVTYLAPMPKVERGCQRKIANVFQAVYTNSLVEALDVSFIWKFTDPVGADHVLVTRMRQLPTTGEYRAQHAFLYCGTEPVSKIYTDGLHATSVSTSSRGRSMKMCFVEVDEVVARLSARPEKTLNTGWYAMIELLGTNEASPLDFPSFMSSDVDNVPDQLVVLNGSLIFGSLPPNRLLCAIPSLGYHESFSFAKRIHPEIVSKNGAVHVKYLEHDETVSDFLPIFIPSCSVHPPRITQVSPTILASGFSAQFNISGYGLARARMHMSSRFDDEADFPVTHASSGSVLMYAQSVEKNQKQTHHFALDYFDARGRLQSQLNRAVNISVVDVTLVEESPAAYILEVSPSHPNLELQIDGAICVLNSKLAAGRAASDPGQVSTIVCRRMLPLVPRQFGSRPIHVKMRARGDNSWHSFVIWGDDGSHSLVDDVVGDVDGYDLK